MGDIDFEEQIELERLEREKREKDKHPSEKVDPDGTVYEWDYDKKAWFPKIDAAFIAQYQMNYGVNTETEESKTDVQTDASGQTQEHYNYAQQITGTGETTGDDPENKTGDEEYQEDSAEVMAAYTEEQKKQYNEYWSYYYSTDYHDYYTDCMTQYGTGNQSENTEATADGAGNHDADLEALRAESKSAGETAPADSKDNNKKGKKRKVIQPKREEGWFEVEQKHNTNIYVSGLPPDINQAEFQDLMAKYGLIMYDPHNKKPKAKLYVDEDGKPKGDGRCCFIKRESVDLALNLLDGLELRGHTIKVEMASFQMKGNYDPTKKKRKLSNKEKRRMKERQSKLFDWRPDKPRNAREKHEKVVVLKNIFDAKDFEDNPALINKVSADMRTECIKYGDVKKVVVYDRHQDGVVMIHFKEPEEADKCVEYMNRKFLGDRRIIAEAWDGKTKYEVVETEAERQARLSKWEKFLESGGEENKSGSKSGTQNGASVGNQGNGSAGNQGNSSADNQGNGSVGNQVNETAGNQDNESAQEEKSADLADKSADSEVKDTVPSSTTTEQKEDPGTQNDTAD